MNLQNSETITHKLGRKETSIKKQYLCNFSTTKMSDDAVLSSFTFSNKLHSASYTYECDSINTISKHIKTLFHT